MPPHGTESSPIADTVTKRNPPLHASRAAFVSRRPAGLAPGEGPARFRVEPASRGTGAARRECATVRAARRGRRSGAASPHGTAAPIP